MFGKLKGSFAHTPQTLALVWKSSPVATAALLVATIFAALFPLGIAWIGKAIVDAVVAHDREVVIRNVAYELALIVGQAATQRGLTLIRALLGARLGIDINVTILRKALLLDLAHFEDSDFYDKLTRARREASSRPLSVVNETFQLLQNGATLIGYASLLLAFSPWAVLGLLIAAIPASIAEVRFSNVAFRLRNWRSPDSRRLNYLEYVLANDDHVKEVKLFGLGQTLLDRYNKLSEQFFREDRIISIKRAGWGYVLSLLGSAAFYGAYAVMAVQAARGTMTIGTLTLYVIAFRQGQQAFQSILAAIGGMYEDNLYMSNLFAFLATPTRVTTAVATPAAATGTASGIRFEDVGFKYPGREGWALRHVTLDITPGESIALVGHNGAGKTTMIKLLTRLYTPNEGRILLDGVDLQAWDEAALRRRIGVVFQDFNQYQLPVRDNVGFGSIEHASDESRMTRAIDQGGAGTMIGELPQGLDTSLGRWFKDGFELSGGQWQKVALARAFMREEADILVLDEPTAALDAEAEHAIFERFRALTKGRTTFLVSHRFPTVRMADRIVVFEQGQIEEIGTHEALVASGKRYAQLFALQAQGYQA